MMKHSRPALISSARRSFAGLLILLSLSACSALTPWVDQASIAEPDWDMEASLRIAEASLRGGEYAAAARLYDRILSEHPNVEEGHVGLATALFAMGKFSEAEDVLVAALDIPDGNRAPVYRSLGRTYLAIGDAERARWAFDNTLAAEPDDRVALNGSGVALDMMGQHRLAQVFYRRVLNAHMDADGTLSNYALSLALSGQYDEAISVVSSLGPSAELSSRMRQNLALAYGLSGDIARAEYYSRMDLNDSATANNVAYFKKMNMRQSMDQEVGRISALAQSLQELPVTAAPIEPVEVIPARSDIAGQNAPSNIPLSVRDRTATANRPSDGPGAKRNTEEMSINRYPFRLSADISEIKAAPVPVFTGGPHSRTKTSI